MQRSRILLGVLLAFVFGHLGSGSARGQVREIVVASYNVENYVGDDASPAGGAPRDGGASGRRGRANAKSEQEIATLVRIIREIAPDILGICEMGGPEQFEDLKGRLRAAGLDYSDSEYLQGADPERRLALLSRFPIVSRQSRGDISYVLNGVPEKVKRGFLDVTIRINPEYDLRMVGAHLKSKLASRQGEALMRRHEAQLLRRHLEQILRSDPETNLLAYGDFNDARNEPAIQEIMGPRGSAMHMADLWAEDEHGDRWTHYWRTADQYSRIDFLFVSPALFKEVVLKKSRVYRSPDWNEASDHRPIYTSIVPVNRRR